MGGVKVAFNSRCIAVPRGELGSSLQPRSSRPLLLVPSTELSRGFHTSNYVTFYDVVVTRRAFVVQLGPETQPARRHFVGSIEEVDTGREARFHSTEGLLSFLGDCVTRAERETSESRNEQEHCDDSSNPMKSKKY